MLCRHLNSHSCDRAANAASESNGDVSGFCLEKDVNGKLVSKERAKRINVQNK